ncbi:hypothetical protein BS17DRAFT_817277 [Gyrodon lividus]|nr:hypothetical protein BS17DRAFT_817277 [Gyrodon lividus]
MESIDLLLLPPPIPAWARPALGQWKSPRQFTSMQQPSVRNLDPETKQHLLHEATSNAFLKLYLFGRLKARSNDSKTWELHCPKGCWVKTGIHSHIKLTTKGQLTTLEIHWDKKSCKKNKGPTNMLILMDTHRTLVEVFPCTTLQQLLEVADKARETSNGLRLESLNDNHKIKRMLAKLEDHTTLTMALSQADMPCT